MNKNKDKLINKIRNKQTETEIFDICQNVSRHLLLCGLDVSLFVVHLK